MEFNMDEMICIYRSDNTIEADLIKSHLESFGISTYLKTNDASGTLPQLRFINPIEILVHNKDIEKARKILQERESNDS